MPYACAYSYCAFACARPEVLATHIKTEHLRGLDNLEVILAARVGTKFVFWWSKLIVVKVSAILLCLVCVMTCMNRWLPACSG